MASKKKPTGKKASNKNNKAGKQSRQLAHMTESALQDYFSTLNGTVPGDLYGLVLSEVERPLLRKVLEFTDGNQSRAAEILGINRGTLRKKLKTYSLG
ncbi:MAG: DNA-binding transcriptional regulator Fis [Pseudomonadota bacterium]